MKSSLRFCMLTTFYPPFNFGGDGIAVQRLSRALVRRGHQVTVVHDVDAYEVLSAGSKRASAEEAPNDGVRVVRLRSGIGPLSPLLTQQTGRPVVHGGRIRRLLARGEFDVLHYHNVSLVGGPGLLSIGDGLKVYEAHEHWLVCPTHVLWRHGRELCTGRQCVRCSLAYRRPPQLWRYTGLLARRLGEIDLFIAKSRFSREKHAEFGFDRPMEVLPYFLPDSDEDEPGGEGPGELSAPQSRPYFLFVGRLEEIKGLDDVIPVFARLPEVDLVVVGDGTHGETLRRAAEGLANVRFTGRLSPGEVARYYRHALALVVPSICYETFGIILIEAFRQGTPVVARSIGPFPEIVNACGGGVLFGDERELLSVLRRLRDDDALRRELGERGRKGARELWSEETVVSRYLEMVGEAAERTGRTLPGRAAPGGAIHQGTGVSG